MSARPPEPTHARILDSARWRCTIEMAELFAVQATYVYQLEWARIPFYAGITVNPPQAPVTPP